MTSKPDEKALVKELQTGSSRAFRLVYERYHKMVYLVALKYLKDEEQSKDVVQSVFLKLWEQKCEAIIAVSLKNYLYTMAKNLILNQIRNNNTALQNNLMIYQSTDIYDDCVGEKLEKDELLKAFETELENLPPTKRMICKYKMEGKLSNVEIAQKMNLSVSSIKQHYSQAVKIMRENLRHFTLIVLFVLMNY